jgi:hypothetical protein
LIWAVELLSIGAEALEAGKSGLHEARHIEPRQCRYASDATIVARSAWNRRRSKRELEEQASSFDARAR